MYRWILPIGYCLNDFVLVLWMMNYKDLEIWKLSRELVIDIHKLSFELQKSEQYKEAQQIRRSMKSVKSNIVEGYGRPR
jgi:hypothetical protein